MLIIRINGLQINRRENNGILKNFDADAAKFFNNSIILHSDCFVIHHYFQGTKMKTSLGPFWNEVPRKVNVEQFSNLKNNKKALTNRTHFYFDGKVS